MKRDYRAYLEDIQRISTDLSRAAINHLRGDLDSNYYFRSTVERELISIGEAVSQILKQRPDFSDRIRYSQKIIGFRNILVHGYFSLDNEIIWNSLQFDLPQLVADVELLLAED